MEQISLGNQGTLKPRIESLHIDTQREGQGTSFSLWEEIRTLGKHPSRRSYHSSVVHNNQMWIYGGQDLREGVLGGLWCLTLFPTQEDEEEHWDELTTQQSPGHLCRHSAVVFNNKMYLFGGTDFIQEYNTLHILDFNSLNWRIWPGENANLPPSMDSHSCITYVDSDNIPWMIAFGGFANGLRCADTYVLNLNTLKWRKGTTQNNPMERAGHSAVEYNGFMYVYGGSNDENDRLTDLWSLNLNTFIWSQIQTGGQIPMGRSGHSAIMFKDVMLIFGGMKDIIKETNELYSYNFATNEWALIQSEMAVNDPVSSEQVEEFKKTGGRPKQSPSPGHELSPRRSPQRTTTGLGKFSTISDDSPSLSPESSFRRGRRVLYEGPTSPIKGRIKRKIPHARDGHTAVNIANTMYVFGGDRHQMPFNDVYAYRIIEETIKTPLMLQQSILITRQSK